MPKPKITQILGGINIEVFGEKEIGQQIDESSEKKLGEKLGENQTMIINLIGEDKYITIPELAKKIKISTTAIENNIAKLKEKGILERIGPDKGGYWEVKLRRRKKITSPISSHIHTIFTSKKFSK
ncbi:MAG: winged helix-turn-helix transcriptional regulator [bacterium]